MAANAWFSALSGLALAAAGPFLAGFVGVEGVVLGVVGAGLVVYGLGLAVAARSDSHRILGGKLAVVADAGWVTGAAGLIVGTDLLTVEGEVALGVVSVVVAGFAVAQTHALRKTGR